MYAPEIAKYRIDDMVREADAFRHSKASRAARAAERRARAKRAAAMVSSVVLWPIKH